KRSPAIAALLSSNCPSSSGCNRVPEICPLPASSPRSCSTCASIGFNGSSCTCCKLKLPLKGLLSLVGSSASSSCNLPVCAPVSSSLAATVCSSNWLCNCSCCQPNWYSCPCWLYSS